MAAFANNVLLPTRAGSNATSVLVRDWDHLQNSAQHSVPEARQHPGISLFAQGFRRGSGRAHTCMENPADVRESLVQDSISDAVLPAHLAGFHLEALKQALGLTFIDHVHIGCVLVTRLNHMHFRSSGSRRRCRSCRTPRVLFLSGTPAFSALAVYTSDTEFGP